MRSERKYRYNLELFKEIKRFWIYRESLGWKTVILNILGNIIAFMPLGFFLPVFSKVGKNCFANVFLSSFFSFLAEGIQLITKVGAFDVDDILLNTIGGFFGFLSYHIVKIIVNKKIIHNKNRRKNS